MKGCSFCVRWKEGVRRPWLECMVLGDTLEQVQMKDPCRPTFLPLWPPLVEPNLSSWFWVGNSIEWKDIVAISLAFQIPIITRLSGPPTSSHYMQMKCLRSFIIIVILWLCDFYSFYLDEKWNFGWCDWKGGSWAYKHSTSICRWAQFLYRINGSSAFFLANLNPSNFPLFKHTYCQALETTIKSTTHHVHLNSALFW